MTEADPTIGPDDPGKTHFYGDGCDDPHGRPGAGVGPPSESRPRPHRPEERCPVAGCPWEVGHRGSHGVEPPSESPSFEDLVLAAEVAWRNVLVAESQGLQADGCCSSETWRGHLCSYHQGFEDGVDVVLERLRALRAMTRSLTEEGT
jgi:hypothetical protein